MSRFRLRVQRRTAETPAPVFNNAPTITSAEPGNYQVGVLLSVGTPDVTPSSATITRRWLRNSSAISGANGTTYLPVEADEAANITCEITATSFGSPTTYTTPAVGPILAGDPPPDLGAAYDGVDADTMARRATIVAQFDNAWGGWGADPADDTISVSSVSELNTALANLSDKTRRVDIVCNSAAPASAWNGALVLRGSGDNANPILAIGHLYGGNRDFIDGGGAVRIRSSDPGNPVAIGPTTGSSNNTITGFRGVELRDINLGHAVDGEPSLIVARDSVSGAGDRICEAQVVRLVNCGIGSYYKQTTPNPDAVGIGIHVTAGPEQLDVIDCVFKGCDNGISASGGHLFRIWGCDFTHCRTDLAAIYARTLSTDLNSSFTQVTTLWRRLCTPRAMVNIPSTAADHADVQQHGTVQNVQHTLSLIEFEVAQMQREDAYRDRVQVSYYDTDTNGPALVDGDTITVKGVTFTLRDNPSAATDIQIEYDAQLAYDEYATNLNIKNTIVNSGLVAGLRAGQRTRALFEFHFDAGEVDTGLTTSFPSSLGFDRLASGMQGFLNADTPTFRIDQVAINCIITGLQNCGVQYNGDSVFDRCVFARVGKVAPQATVAADGFDADLDDGPHTRSGPNAAFLGVSNHIVRNCVDPHVVDRLAGNGVNYDTDGARVIGNRTLTMSNNRYPKWVVSDGKTVITALNGPFTERPAPDDRVEYDVQNDGLNSQAAFRAEMYSVLKLANVTDRASIGPTDPATWPTS